MICHLVEHIIFIIIYQLNDYIGIVVNVEKLMGGRRKYDLVLSLLLSYSKYTFMVHLTCQIAVAYDYLLEKKNKI